MTRYIVWYEFRVEASDQDEAAVAASDAYNERDFQNVTIVEEEPQDGMTSLLAVLQAAQRRTGFHDRALFKGQDNAAVELDAISGQLVNLQERVRTLMR